MKNPVKLKMAKRLYAYDLPKEIINKIRISLTVPNPKWLDNQRMGRSNWETNKDIILYQEKKNFITMPIGYYDDLLRILKQHDLDSTLYDVRITVEKQFTFKGELKDFQKEAVDNTFKHNCGTICAPTGSGKTVMGLYIVAKRKQKTLIIVHTKELAFQWMDRIETFLNIKKDKIGLIGNGKKIIGDRITVALVQSVYKIANSISREFGFIIIDECHRAPSRTFTEAVNKFSSKYMLGLTATPYRRDKLSQLIFWYVGKIRYSIKKEKLVNEGHIVKAQYIMRSTDFKPYYDPVSEYTKMLSELTQDEKRNTLICSDIAHMVFKEYVCIVLTDRKSHCYDLKDMLFKNHNIYAECLNGDVKEKDRKEVIRRINEKQSKLIIATGQLIGEGFDCKDLSVLFIATPIKFAGRVTQYVGRVLRPTKEKEKAIIIDYADWTVPTLANMAKNRIRVYGKENTIHR